MAQAFYLTPEAIFHVVMHSSISLDCYTAHSAPSRLKTRLCSCPFSLLPMLGTELTIAVHLWRMGTMVAVM